jgi:hypothetical protein
MSATRRIKIRLEKHELTIVRMGRRQRFFCAICRAETLHLTVTQTAVVLTISEMNVFRLAVAEQIHSIETREGKLMICADSIYTDK